MNQAQGLALQNALSVTFYQTFQAYSPLNLDQPSSLSCAVREQHLPRPFNSRHDWQGDIAVLLLNRSCPLQKYVFFEWRLSPPTIPNLWTSGFGSTNLSQLRPIPSRLKTLTLTHFESLKSREQIANLYDQIEQDYGPQTDKQIWVENFYRKIQTRSHFCFLSRDGAAPVFGDSGGPLYTRKGRQLYLLGIVSHIYLLKNPKRVHSFCFQNIGPYRHWIYSIGKN